MNDGGPAFPRLVALRSKDRNINSPNFDADVVGGMSLRDWFAGMALQVVHADGGRYGPEGLDQVAKYSYAMADAMLKYHERQEVVA